MSVPFEGYLVRGVDLNFFVDCVLVMCLKKSYSITFLSFPLAFLFPKSCVLHPYSLNVFNDCEIFAVNA